MSCRAGKRATATSMAASCQQIASYGALPVAGQRLEGLIQNLPAQRISTGRIKVPLILGGQHVRLPPGVCIETGRYKDFFTKDVNRRCPCPLTYAYSIKLFLRCGIL